MAETTYYNDGAVLITSARATFSNRTFAVMNIASVSAHRIDPGTGGAMLLIVLGALLLMFGVFVGIVGTEGSGSCAVLSALFGALFVGTGIAWRMLLKTRFVIRVTSGAGEVDAFSSTDERYAQAVLNALNQALVSKAQ